MDRLALAGIQAPWRHQVQAAELARAGRSVIIATGTASGKSLAYLLPALTAVLGEDADERAPAGVRGSRRERQQRQRPVGDHQAQREGIDHSHLLSGRDRVDHPAHEARLLEG